MSKTDKKNGNGNGKATETPATTAGGTTLMLDPDKVVIVGRDTKEDEDHILYDPNAYSLKVDEDLLNSLKSGPQINPIQVRKNGASYEVVCGRGRVKALRELNRLGKESGEAPRMVRAEVVDTSDVKATVEMVIAENVSRKYVGPLDKGLAVARLQKFGVKIDRIATILGGTPVSVHNWKRLLSLPEQVQSALRDGEISPTMGYRLATLPKDKVLEFFRTIMDMRHQKGATVAVSEFDAMMRARDTASTDHKKEMVDEEEAAAAEEAEADKSSAEKPANGTAPDGPAPDASSAAANGTPPDGAAPAKRAENRMPFVRRVLASLAADSEDKEIKALDIDAKYVQAFKFVSGEISGKMLTGITKAHNIFAARDKEAEAKRLKSAEEKAAKKAEAEAKKAQAIADAAAGKLSPDGGGDTPSAEATPPVPPPAAAVAEAQATA